MKDAKEQLPEAKQEIRLTKARLRRSRKWLLNTPRMAKTTTAAEVKLSQGGGGFKARRDITFISSLATANAGVLGGMNGPHLDVTDELCGSPVTTV